MPDFIVAPEQEGISVRNFLRRHCGVSARLLARLKRTANGITRCGEPLRSIDVLHAGDRVSLCFPEDTCTIQAVELPLEVVYEDDTLLVVNKPPFQPVHPVHEHQRDTLANAVVFYSRQKGENYTFRAVNRLDRDTSGLVLIAKNSFAHTFLAGRVQKTYTALCEGYISGCGTLNDPIRLKEGHTIQRETGRGGVSAVTHYRVIRQAFGHTLLSLWLETGRTHQIRTHLSSIGHPLAGDEMYGGSRAFFDRQCLHCQSLTLVHPLTGSTLFLTRPAEDWLSVLQNRSS